MQRISQRKATVGDVRCLTLSRMVSNAWCQTDSATHVRSPRCSCLQKQGSQPRTSKRSRVLWAGARTSPGILRVLRALLAPFQVAAACAGCQQKKTQEFLFPAVPSSHTHDTPSKNGCSSGSQPPPQLVGIVHGGRVQHGCVWVLGQL